MSNVVSFPARNGKPASGELVLPGGAERAPGLILVQEWWGLNDHIRSMAARFAAAGFVVLAIDLYHGKVTKDPTEAGKLMQALDGDQAIEEIAGAIAFLKAHPRVSGRVGITGFCMGGAFSFRAAANLPELAAAVPFYGVPPAEKADFSKVKCPVQAHFAARDQWAAPAKAAEIQKTIQASGGQMELFVYEADHAFVNDTRPDVYDKEAAGIALGRAIAFLAKNLH